MFLCIICFHLFFAFSIQADEVVNYTELEDELLKTMNPENLPQEFELRRYSSISLDSKSYLKSLESGNLYLPIFQIDFEFSNEKSEVFFNGIMDFDKNLNICDEYNKRYYDFHKNCVTYNNGLLSENDFLKSIFNSHIVHKTIYDPITSKTAFENCLNYDPNAPLFQTLLVFLSNKIADEPIDFSYNPFHEILKVEF